MKGKLPLFIGKVNEACMFQDVCKSCEPKKLKMTYLPRMMSCPLYNSMLSPPLNSCTAERNLFGNDWWSLTVLETLSISFAHVSVSMYFIHFPWYLARICCTWSTIFSWFQAFFSLLHITFHTTYWIGSNMVGFSGLACHGSLLEWYGYLNALMDHLDRAMNNLTCMAFCINLEFPLKPS